MPTSDLEARQPSEPGRAERLDSQRRDNFGRLLARALAVFEEDLARVSHARGRTELPRRYLPVLRALDLEGSRIGDIARRAGLAKQTIGPLVRGLAERSIVVIEPDPNDGRAKLVRFTEAGLQEVGLGLDAIREVVDRYTAVLGEQFMWHLQSSLLMFTECFAREDGSE